MPLWVQLLIGLFLGILIPLFITALAAYFDKVYIVITGYVIFLIILFLGENGTEGFLHNISLVAFYESIVLFFSILIATVIDPTDDNFLIVVIGILVIFNLVFMPIQYNALKKQNREYVETDEVRQIQYELVSDKNGKFMYYYSPSDSAEEYYIVYYKEKNDNGEVVYKDIKISKNQLDILNGIESSDEHYLYVTYNTHIKECISDRSIEPEITESIKYKVYLPEGISNISII